MSTRRLKPLPESSSWAAAERSRGAAIEALKAARFMRITYEGNMLVFGRDPADTSICALRAREVAYKKIQRADRDIKHLTREIEHYTQQRNRFTQEAWGSRW